MELDDLEVSRGLLSFIDASPTAFQAVEESAERLEEAGFTGLDETEAWEIEPGRGYYTTRNGSAIIAFVAPEDLSDYHFRLTASHCDSPTFKLKNTPELKGAEGYVKLNVEGYGGM
ncbi:MAG: M18 family aminopeptidase, partial [Atopobiaceae bacterium]|nr:M18 family aminopeptidase [Atopobiaceae bacterium]